MNSKMNGLLLWMKVSYFEIKSQLVCYFERDIIIIEYKGETSIVWIYKRDNDRCCMYSYIS